MKDISEDHGKAKAGFSRARCFMAYTLNNTQPVICTLVSDQPYFYMEDCEGADDRILDSTDSFERDLAEIERKLYALETASALHERDPIRRIEAVIAESINIFVETPTGAATLEPLLTALSKSRTASSLVEFAATSGVEIVSSGQVFSANYDRDSQKIFVNPIIGIYEQYLVCTRELRRHWQHKKGIAFSAKSFHPDHAVLVNRAIEADLAATMARVMWDLQLAGMKDAWVHFETTPYAPIARAYAREAFLDFRSIASGKAAAAAFESWFLSDHCQLADKRLIQTMLADSHSGYIFGDEAGSRTIARKLLAVLGEQPWGKNYLTSYIDLMMEDALFTEVRDRSNANFLWFIKFERSFLQTEDALQNASDGVGYGAHTLPPDLSHEDIHPSDQPKIISLAERGIFPRRRSKSVSGQDNGAGNGNVIRLPFGNNFTR